MAKPTGRTSGLGNATRSQGRKGGGKQQQQRQQQPQQRQQQQQKKDGVVAPKLSAWEALQKARHALKNLEGPEERTKELVRVKCEQYEEAKARWANVIKRKIEIHAEIKKLEAECRKPAQQAAPPPEVVSTQQHVYNAIAVCQTSKQSVESGQTAGIAVGVTDDNLKALHAAHATIAPPHGRTATGIIFVAEGGGSCRYGGGRGADGCRAKR